VWKMENDHFGLVFDHTNPTIAVVFQVASEGQAAKWNQRAEASMQLRPGLGLRSLDGVEQETKKLLERLKESTGHLRLGFTQPSLETLSLQQTPGMAWDMDLLPTQVGLYVRRCGANASRSGLQAGMHICSVNGCMGDAKSLLQVIEAQSKLCLRVASFEGPLLRVASFV
ncbi:unnamed protein product, partial [Durusdinium trenchii]